MRIVLARHMMENPQLEVGGNSITDWIAMERHMPLRSYAQRMAISGWGGAVELATFAHMQARPVHVFESGAAMHQYRCIAQFGNSISDDTLYIYIMRDAATTTF